MLFVPGSHERAMQKSRGLVPDMICFDLEDAVAPETKAAARDRVVSHLASLPEKHCITAVRINGLGTQWGGEDLEAISHTSADAVLMPKVSRAEDLLAVQQGLDQASSAAQIWAMLETPLAVLNAQSIAATSKHTVPRLALFVMGLNDLALEMCLPPGEGRSGLREAMAHCLLAARAYDIGILDGVYNRFQDLEGFRAECEDGRRFGFDGKSLIHPSQVQICNQVFSPSAEDVENARKIILAAEAAGAAGQGAIAVDGVMVEALHIEAAKRVLALAG